MNQTQPPSLSATLNLTINRFRPIGGIFPISASMQLQTTNPANFALDDKNLTVMVPAGYPCPVQLTFQLNDPNHVLLGIAFAANEPGPTCVGRTEFPVVAINRLAGGSSMVVSDSCSPSQNDIRFDYVILVQSLRTGEIGLIDPDIETEITE